MIQRPRTGDEVSPAAALVAQRTSAALTTQLDLKALPLKLAVAMRFHVLKQHRLLDNVLLLRPT